MAARSRSAAASGGASRAKQPGGDTQADKSIAMAHARSLVPIFAALDHLPAAEVAATLNARGVPTPQGKPWSALMVIRTRGRIGKIARRK